MHVLEHAHTHKHTCTHTHTPHTCTHTPHTHTQNDKLPYPLPLAYSPITKAFNAVCPLACVITEHLFSLHLQYPLQAISWFTNLICSLYLPLYTLYAAYTYLFIPYMQPIPTSLYLICSLYLPLYTLYAAYTYLFIPICSLYLPLYTLYAAYTYLFISCNLHPITFCTPPPPPQPPAAYTFQLVQLPATISYPPPPPPPCSSHTPWCVAPFTTYLFHIFNSM